MEKKARISAISGPADGSHEHNADEHGAKQKQEKYGYKGLLRTHIGNINEHGLFGELDKNIFYKAAQVANPNLQAGDLLKGPNGEEVQPMHFHPVLRD